MSLKMIRKLKQSVWINCELKIVIDEIKGKAVRLRFEGADHWNIQRTERIQNALGVLSCRHAKQICPPCLKEVLLESSQCFCTSSYTCMVCKIIGDLPKIQNQEPGESGEGGPQISDPLEPISGE